nr:MAG TPA: hypothetical protein [Caudoviricetes sp.]
MLNRYNIRAISTQTLILYQINIYLCRIKVNQSIKNNKLKFRKYESNRH